MQAMLDGKLNQRHPYYVHLQSCNTCKKTFNEIEQLLQKNNNTAIEPSIYTDQKIQLAIRKNFKEETTAHPPKKPLLFKYIAGFATLTILLISMTMMEPQKSPNVSIVNIKHIKGRLIVNNSNARIKDELLTQTTLTTAKNSKAQIVFKDFSTITIAENSKLEINNQQSSNTSKKHSWKSAIKLICGSIYCTFRHKNINIDFSLKTKFATIDTIGTEFLLQATKKQSNLILTEGKIRVTTKSTQQLIHSNKYNKYIIAKNITSDTLSNSDKNSIKSFKQYNHTINNPDRQIKNNQKHNSKQIKQIRKNLKKTRKELRKNLREQRKEMNKMKKHIRKDYKKNSPF